MPTVGDLIGSAAEEKLSDAAQESLLTLLQTDPEHLESFLTGKGAKDGVAATASAEETIPEPPTLDERLSAVPETTRELYEVIKEISEPMTRSEIAKHIKENHSEFLQKHKSAEHSSWLSTQLNKLARNGVIGKFRYEKNILWTPDIYEAIDRWSKINQPMETLSVDDADQIAADMGVPYRVVYSKIREQSGERH